MLRRGEVWWADFGERRAVVLLHENGAEFECMQIVEPADTDITGWGLEVPLGAADGLPLEGVVRVAFPRPGITPCTWLATVTERDVLERAGEVSEAKLAKIDEAIRLGEVPIGREAPALLDQPAQSNSAGLGELIRHIER